MTKGPIILLASVGILAVGGLAYAASSSQKPAASGGAPPPQLPPAPAPTPAPAPAPASWIPLDPATGVLHGGDQILIAIDPDQLTQLALDPTVKAGMVAFLNTLNADAAAGSIAYYPAGSQIPGGPPPGDLTGPNVTHSEFRMSTGLGDVFIAALPGVQTGAIKFWVFSQ